MGKRSYKKKRAATATAKAEAMTEIEPAESSACRSIPIYAF